MSDMQVTPEMLKVVGGVCVGALSLMLAAVGFLIRTAYKIGQDAQKVGTSLETLTIIKVQTDKIPIIETRLGTVEEAWKNTRSDIKHLLRGSRPEADAEE